MPLVTSGVYRASICSGLIEVASWSLESRQIETGWTRIRACMLAYEYKARSRLLAVVADHDRIRYFM